MSSGQHQRVERRLAAIPTGDVAGYSRLIEADEEGTLRRFKALRAEIIDPKIAGHRGSIVDQGSQNGGPRHETSLEQCHDRCGARDSDTSVSTAHGPGPFRGNRYRPGRRSPGGAGSLLSAPQSAGWVSRSIHRGAVGGRAAAVLHPASALLCPAGRLLPAVRLLCPARPRLLRSAARLLLWAAGTVTRKSRLAGEPKDPGTACPSRVSSTWSRLPPCRCCVCRTWSRRAAHATPERRYQRRICGPSRHRRALSGGRMPCIIR